MHDNCEEIEQRYLRALADFDNLKKRMPLHMSTAKKDGIESVMRRFIELLDSVAMWHKHISSGKAHIEDCITALNFIDVAITELMAAFNVVKSQSSVGTSFDPNIHEAIERIEGEEHNVVIKEHECAFTINDKLIRPAKVTVSVRKGTNAVFLEEETSQS